MADWIRKTSQILMFRTRFGVEVTSGASYLGSPEKISNSKYPANFSTVVTDEILPDFKNK